MEKIISMRTEKKTAVKNSFWRMATTGILVILQVLWMSFVLLYLNSYYAGISLISTGFAIFIAFKIYGTPTNSSMKLPWILVLLSFPLLGLLIYMLFGRSIVTKNKREKFNIIEEDYKKITVQDPEIIKEIEEKDIRLANQFRYLSEYEGYPIYKNTDVEFYDYATAGLDAQIEEIKKAKHFIFMEYHAIEDAIAFNRLKDALIERARAGVEVRMFYDDVGCVFFLNKDFIKEMRANGIECRVFNPVTLVFNMFMNNRDHRKITVIDGIVGFTGGYNLADEYFNITHPYGEWKDTGIKLKGDAVNSLTSMFLAMWNSINKTDESNDNYKKYLHLSRNKYKSQRDEYVLPYADNPLDDNRVAENAYLNIIKNAKKYLYITTPYLLITEDMTRELCMASMRGVDVRIVTPGIPDKKITYSLTRSYYIELVKAGIKIYEYTPGFMHAKQWLCDDEISIIGTINMDFRSLYLHFENAVLVYGKYTASNLLNDFENIFAKSENVSEKHKNKPRKLRLQQCLLRLVAPLF